MAFKKHAVVSLNSDLRQAVREGYEKESYTCPKHGDQVLKYFCTSCESLVCNECIVSSHHSHKYDAVELVMEEQKTELQSMCSVLEQALPHLSRANSESKDVTNSINSHVLSVRTEIEEAFSGVMAAVEKRKQELLAEAEGMAIAKKSRLQIQQEDLEKLSIDMRLALDTIQHSTQSYSPVELLSMKTVLKQACSKLQGQFTKASLVPATSPVIVASVSTTDIIAAINSFGSIEEKLPCSPRHSGLVGINTKFPIGITKDAKCTFILQTRNSRGEPLGTGQVSVLAWVMDKSGRRVCDAEVSCLDGGRYEITFWAEEECSGEAHFTANGEHVDGSPCDVLVRDYAQVKTPLLSFKTTREPAYLYVSHGKSDIFVTVDSGDVCLYSKDGVLKSTIDGSSLGLQRPRGIVVDEENEVMYVASARNNKIVKATIDGKLLSSVGSKGFGHLQFAWPSGVCQDASSNIYVADYHNKRVQVLGPDLTFKREIKYDGRPLGVAVDERGDVHVATDSGIMIFPRKIRYGSRVKCDDIVIGLGNCKFVSCRHDASLEIYKADSTLVGTIRGLQLALGVCLDQSGYVYLADYYGNEVYKF